MRFRLLLCVILVGHCAGAQQNVADSIRKLLQQPMPDSAYCKTMLNLGVAYEPFDSAKAVETYRSLRDYATAHKLDFFVARGYYFEAYFYRMAGHYESARNAVEKGLTILEKNPSRAYQVEYARELTVLSESLRALGYMDQSLAVNHKIISIKEKLGTILPRDYSNLATAYQRAADSLNEHKWYDRAIAFARERQRKEELFAEYLNVSLYYTRINDFQTAKKCVDTARQFYFIPYDTLVKRIGPDLAYHSFQIYYLLAANTFDNLQQYDSALYFFGQALQFAKDHHVARDYVEPLQNMGHLYVMLKDYKKAKELLFEALQMAETNKNIPQQSDAHLTLSKAYAAAGEYKDAYEHFQRFHSLYDSSSGLERKKYATELEAKYESDKKESQIKLQKAEIKQRSTLNYLLGGSALTLCFVTYLLYRNYKNRQTIQTQRIAELEAEKRLTATEAVLAGEEKERRRIAKDLHDGLSGMLSGAKFSLQNMKGNLIMTAENQQAFERSMDMLDSSINEMRRVAQNLMPEALIKFGLDAALRDFTEDINRNGLIRLSYQSMGLDGLQAEQSVLLSLYRIIQELVNNIIKHAHATEGLVQVFFENGKLVLNVEDNGKGMNPDAAGNSPSMGWKNILSRSELLQGQYNIQSEPGKGTSVNFEFDINKK